MKSTPFHLKTRNQPPLMVWRILRIAVASLIAWIGLFFTIIGDGFFRLADIVGGEAFETFGEEPPEEAFMNKIPQSE